MKSSLYIRLKNAAVVQLHRPNRFLLQIQELFPLNFSFRGFSPQPLFALSLRVQSVPKTLKLISINMIPK